MRNNVTRMLDVREIPYSIHELPTDAKLSAVEVANLLNLSPEVVFKTIVATRPKRGKPILALVPGDGEVDLRSLAAALGEKKVTLATEREAERITGLKTGGISPLALLHKPFDVVIDSSASRLEKIYISGGQRGLDIGIAPGAFREITGARAAPIRRSTATHTPPPRPTSSG